MRLLESWNSITLYRTYSKYSDKQVRENSVDTYQTPTACVRQTSWLIYSIIIIIIIIIIIARPRKLDASAVFRLYIAPTIPL